MEVAMKRNRSKWCVQLVLFIGYLGCATASQAYVFASSDMQLYNLQFTSSDSNAQLTWTDDWYGQVSAFAQDTASGSRSDFNDLLGNYGSIKAEADTTYVHSLAKYVVSDGANVALNPGGSIAGTTHSHLEIPDQIVAQGDGDARSNFDNFFMVTKKDPTIPGDTVDVTFSLNYIGELTGKTDEYGVYFRVALAGLMELTDLDKNILGYDIIYDIHSGGSNTYFYQDYRGTLIAFARLNYDNEYWLYSEADSEVSGANTVPEPSTLLLLLCGVGLAASYKVLRRSYTR